MVKEVEFSNESEVLAELENYSNAADQPLFDGYLEDEGTTLKVVIHYYFMVILTLIIRLLTI